MGSNDFLWYLAVLSFRSLGLACLAWLALCVFRVKSASVRHAAWTVVTAVMLVQVGASTALPPVPLRVLAPVPDAGPTLPSQFAFPPIPIPVSNSPGWHLAFTWREVVIGIYAVVAIALLLQLAFGYMFARRLVRNSKPVDGPRVRESETISVPMTVGKIAPAILLPIGWREWDSIKFQAVLAHEEAHIRRADWAIGVMARVNCCIFWFHPLAWWLKRELALLAEYSCDDLALTQMGDRRAYARALLEIAYAMKSARGRLWEQAVPMAKETNVEKRMEQILDDARTISPSFGRRGWVTLLVCSLPVGYFVSAVQLAPAQNRPVASVAEPPAAKQPVQVMPVQIAQAKSEQTPAQAPTAAVSPSQKRHDEVVFVISDVERMAFNRLQTEDERKQFVAQLARPPVPVPTRTPAASPYQRWLDEEVVYIISDDERRAFTRLQTDDERNKFIEQFWLRRDPTPGTEENEFKVEMYRRIAFTNDHFSAGIPGWKTDRGAIYMRYGPPDGLDSHGATSTNYPYETWTYRYLEGIGMDVELEFVDPTMTGRYHLTKDPTEKEVRAALIRQGEILTIAVLGASDLGRTVAVNPDGNVNLPLVGGVKAEGLSLSQFAQAVQRALSTYISNPQVTAGRVPTR
ncbi:MAG TPA: GWxTD domain-containing protein [Bryobacteraceae bacterium]|jgi:GWxTD domain-containing protein|nr:GWxTD domain-containing protein [Bryobacteraceae bacterium]